MAVSLTHNCPHCGTSNSGFSYKAAAKTPRFNRHWSIFFTCNACNYPVAAVVTLKDHESPASLEGELRFHLDDYEKKEFFPSPKPESTPGHCPDSIGRAFIQAEGAIRRQHWEAATAMDRRALEISTKEIAPEHAGLTLYKRIEKLAEEGALTPSLKEWAHGLRSIGNDALHEIDGLSEAEARQAHELTRFVLTYLYTLPAQVEAAREARKNGN